MAVTGPKPRPEADRFWEKVVAGPQGCWIWASTLSDENYGLMKIGSQTDGTRRNIYAHIWAWREANGDVPEGMELDHLCHTRDENCPGGPTCLHRRCVNPGHLEAVTPQENTRRIRNPGRKPGILRVDGKHVYPVPVHVRPDGSFMARGKMWTA